MVNQRFQKPIAITLTPMLILVLLFAAACATAAPAEPQVVEKQVVVEKEIPIEVVVEKEVVKEVEKLVVATPTPAAEPASEVHPGTLTIMLAELGNERFDYNFATTSPGGRSYGRSLYGFLISENERKLMVPGIATRWDLSADGLTWTFTIRERVNFHDGSEVTPEDVRWSWQHSFGPEAVEYTQQTTAAAISREIDTIELGGPDQVALTTKVPSTAFPLIVSRAGVWSFAVMPQRADVHDEALERAYDESPIGAGPMSLDRHIKASMMKFERFDDYYYQPGNGLPEDQRMNFQWLELFVVPEAATRVAALRAGEADIAPVNLAAKKQVEAGGGRMVFGQEATAIENRLIGCWQPQACHDKRVRQALDYAIDKELIRDTLYGPEVFQVKGWVGVTPSSMGYVPELDPRPFDPDKARQLLADAGYPGGEGYPKLIVNTWIASTPFVVEAAQLAAEFWKKELGLDVEVRVGDEGGIKKAQYGRQLDGQIMWRDNETKIDISGTLVSQFGRPDSKNRFHEDPELYAAVNEAVEILDAEERTEALTKLLLRLKDESYWLTVGYVNLPWGVGPRIVAWEPYPVTDYASALHTIRLK